MPAQAGGLTEPGVEQLDTVRNRYEGVGARSPRLVVGPRRPQARPLASHHHKPDYAYRCAVSVDAIGI